VRSLRHICRQPSITPTVSQTGWSTQTPEIHKYFPPFVTGAFSALPTVKGTFVEFVLKQRGALATELPVKSCPATTFRVAKHPHSPSGLSVIPYLQWGSHLTQFFGSGEELRDVLVPISKQGLSCLWVTGPAFSAEDARSALRAVVPTCINASATGKLRSPMLIRGTQQAKSSNHMILSRAY